LASIENELHALRYTTHGDLGHGAESDHLASIKAALGAQWSLSVIGFLVATTISACCSQFDAEG
jgi:hypothetical protein